MGKSVQTEVQETWKPIAKKDQPLPPRRNVWPALVFATFLALPAMWLLVFGAYVTAAVFALPSAAMAVWGWPRRILAMLFPPAVSVLVLLHVPQVEYTRRVDALVKKRTADFTTRDLAGVWGLNIAMSFGGLACGIPEAAQETFLLSLPGDNRRPFEGDFAMRSPKVRAALTAMIAEARASGKDDLDLGPRAVTWANYESDAPRVALALNALTLTAHARRDGRDGWKLNVKGRVAVRYPDTGTVPIAKDVVIHERLFAVLQERGWLFPYEAEWRWTITDDDPRLKQDRPTVSGIERAIFLRGSKPP